MSRTRINRNEFRDKLAEAIRLSGAEQFIGCSNPDGKAVYANASRIADGIVNRLERDYAIVRKAKKERTC